MWELTFSKIPDSFSSRSDFFYTLKCEEPQNEQYALSQESQTLLKAASKQDDGTILNISNIGVRVIQAGGESFGGERGREAAKWEAALEELLGFLIIL